VSVSFEVPVSDYLVTPFSYNHPILSLLGNFQVFFDKLQEVLKKDWNLSEILLPLFEQTGETLRYCLEQLACDFL